MSERERELIQRIAKNMPSLNDSEQQYVIGVVDGIALAKSGIEESETDSKEISNWSHMKDMQRKETN